MAVNYYKRRKAYLFTYSNYLNYVLDCLKIMEKGSLNDPDFIDFVISNFSNIPRSKIVFEVWRWIFNNIKYQSDEHDEDITIPIKLIKKGAGDCDDMALLAKSIFNFLNVPSRYLLLGKNPGEFTHIVVLVDDQIVDPTNQKFNSIPENYKYKVTV